MCVKLRNMPSTSKIRNEYARMRKNAQTPGGGPIAPPPDYAYFA